MLFLRENTRDIAANDLMWEYFEKHPLPPRRDSGR